MRSGATFFSGTRKSRDAEAKKGLQQLSDIRLEGRTQYARSDQYVRDEFKALVWDTDSNRFVERFDVYSDTPELKSSSEREVYHSRVLNGDYVSGAVVDQVKQRIVLPDGGWIDGPTGDIYSVQGLMLFKRSGPLEESEKNL
jgi:hypothetical protein